MRTIYKVMYFVPSSGMTSGGYQTSSQEFESRSQASDFAQAKFEEHGPDRPLPKIWERTYREDGDPYQCEHCDFTTMDQTQLIEEPGTIFACQDCHDNCEHEWDPDEGGMCINCGRDDYYNYIGD